MEKARKNQSELPSDLDATKACDSFYGNGRVFIARDSRHIELNGANFNCERLDDDGDFDGEYWVLSETVVALGADVSRRQAVTALKNIIKALKAGKSSEEAGERKEKKRTLRKRKQRANR